MEGRGGWFLSCWFSTVILRSWGDVPLFTVAANSWHIQASHPGPGPSRMTEENNSVVHPWAVPRQWDWGTGDQMPPLTPGELLCSSWLPRSQRRPPESCEGKDKVQSQPICLFTAQCTPALFLLPSQCLPFLSSQHSTFPATPSSAPSSLALG